MATNDKKRDENTAVESAHAAGGAVRNFFAAPTAYGAMGESFRQRGQAQTSIAAPVRAFGAGLAGAEVPKPAAPAPATPAPAAPKINLIEASNPASMNIAPPAPVGNPARSPASQAPSAGAAAPAGGVAAPSPGNVVGTFNGREITRDDANAAAARLPTVSGPVSMGPNGSFAAATGGITAPTAAGTQAAAQNLGVTAPSLPSVDTSRVRAAEQERLDGVERLNDAIRRLEATPSSMNSRGERALYAQLVGLRNSLTQQAGTLAGAAAGQQLDAATAVGTAQMGQQGENQRALLADERVRDLVQDRVADLPLALQRCDHPAQPDHPPVGPADTRAGAGVVEREPPPGQPVLPHESGGQLACLGQLHLVPLCRTPVRVPTG